MVLDLEERSSIVLDPPPPPLPRGTYSTSVQLRSRYHLRADSLIPVALYVGTPPVLVDGCVIEEISWGWGAGSDAGVLTVADAGGGTIRLYDPERRFDPTNDDSTAVITEIGTRIQVQLAGLPAFTGRVDDVSHDLTTADIAVVDDVSALAAIQFVETSVPAEVASARISRILDLASWPAAARDITAGGVPLQAGTVSQDAWSELVEVTRNELGALWIGPNGFLAWRPRASAWAGGTPSVVFGCPPSDAYLIAMDTRSDQAALVNVLSASRRGGTARTVTDSPSLTSYGRRSHVQNDLELADDPTRDLWQDFYLRRQATPARGIAGFLTRPGSAAIKKILPLPFGAIVRVVDSGHGPDIDRPARWIGAHWTIQPHLIELVSVTGEDASIRRVERHLVIDTPTEWASYVTTPAAINVTAREPGLAITTIPPRPVAL